MAGRRLPRAETVCNYLLISIEKERFKHESAAGQGLPSSTKGGYHVSGLLFSWLIVLFQNRRTQAIFPLSQLHIFPECSAIRNAINFGAVCKQRQFQICRPWRAFFEEAGGNPRCCIGPQAEGGRVKRVFSHKPSKPSKLSRPKKEVRPILPCKDRKLCSIGAAPAA